MYNYNKFISDVIDGKQVAGKKIIKACERHLRDLELSKNKDYPYYFNEDWSNKYIDFIRLMRVPEGELKGQEFPLLAFQEFIIAMIFGWRKKSNNKRRFREAYIQMAKKNGKTTLMAAILVAVCYLEPDGKGQYIFAATTRSQANLCFDFSVQIVNDLIKDLPESVGSITETLANAIRRTDTNSSIFSVSKQADNVEGKGGNVVVIDEYHVHKTNKLKDNLFTGQSGRVDPLMLDITTAGDSIGGVCHQKYEYCEKLLNQQIEDDTLLPIIFEIDKDDDWKDEKVYIKANPAIGITPKWENILSYRNTAINSGGFAEQDFKTKHLNLWVATSSVWIPDDLFMGCKVKNITHSGLSYGGLDLAQRNDFTAEVRYYPDSKTYNVDFWISEKKLHDKSDYVDYVKWANMGLIRVAGKEATNLHMVKEDIKNLNKLDKTICTYYDPHLALQLAEDLEEEGIKMKSYNQSYSNMSPPIQEIERLIVTKAIKHDGNPVMRWMMSNVQIVQNASGYRKITKRDFKKKVDGPVALCMAISCAIHEKVKKSKIKFRAYDQNGNLINDDQQE